MNRKYYYLALNNEYIIVVAQDGSDRVGLLGVTFAGTTLAAEFVAQLNADEAQAEADNNSEEA